MEKQAASGCASKYCRAACAAYRAASMFDKHGCQPGSWSSFGRSRLPLIDEFPDSAFQAVALRALEKLVAPSHSREGKPGGWAGGIVHAITKYARLGQHVVLNSELEVIFGVSIGTIRKRAEQIWPIIRSEVERLLSDNGRLEDIHASVDSDGNPRITDPEMKHLMMEASGKLAKLLEMKATDPEGYLSLLKAYNRLHCHDWVR